MALQKKVPRTRFRPGLEKERRVVMKAWGVICLSFRAEMIAIESCLESLKDVYSFGAQLESTSWLLWSLYFGVQGGHATLVELQIGLKDIVTVLGGVYPSYYELYVVIGIVFHFLFSCLWSGYHIILWNIMWWLLIFKGYYRHFKIL